MARRRLKHKEVIETMKQDDFEVALDRVKSYWNQYIKPNEKVIWGVAVGVLVVASFWLFWRNQKANSLENANAYLRTAQESFSSGDTEGALTELNYILPPGEHADNRVEVAAHMAFASIAYATGDYETAIETLTEILGRAPQSLVPDLTYALADAQEANGDFEAALESLSEVESHLGPEPDSSDPHREASVWDRFYYRKGRLLNKLGKEQEATAMLLKVAEVSRWSLDARSELAWMKGKPAGSIPTKWSTTPGS